MLTAVAGCFAYDSRWAQQQEEQKRAAERLRPAKLSREGPASRDVKTAYVRAYATRAYATETIHWEQRFEQLLLEASAVLEPALGVTLENGGTSGWKPTAPEDRLEDVLDELAERDPGKDVTWVVGFVESTPKLVSDYHALGMGRLFSKHLVLRASNDPRELEILTHQFFKLGEREIAQLHTERKRHRMVTVFLHELGHTLGTRHRAAKDTIMAPAYDPEVVGFDGTTLGLLRITLPQHLASAPPEERHRAALAYYGTHMDGWVSSELASAMGSREQEPSRSPVPAPGPASTASSLPAVSASGSSVRGLDALSASDRDRYDESLAAEGAGASSRAWLALLPIVETNPDVLEVQELRCRLAQKRGSGPMIVEAHCAPAAALRARASEATDRP